MIKVDRINKLWPTADKVHLNNAGFVVRQSSFFQLPTRCLESFAATKP